MRGLGLSAAVADINGTGYLGGEEALGAQRLRMEYAAHCEGIAAEYLAVHAEPGLAMRAIRDDFAALAASTDTGRLTGEESMLVDRFVVDLAADVQRLASWPEWKRAVVLWGFRTPHFIKACLATAVVCGIAIPLIAWVGR